MSLKYLSTQKVKRVFAVVLSVNILLYAFIIPSNAYSVSQAGINKLYTWSWSGAENSIRSAIIEGGTPSLQLTASAFGTTVRQNGGVNVSSTPLHETINVANGNQNEVTIWVAGSRTAGAFPEGYSVIFETSTGQDETFTTTRDFTLQVEYQTILHVEDEGYWAGGTIGDLSSLRLYNAGTQVYNLQPSYTLVEELPQNSTSDERFTFYRVIAFFVVDNYDEEKVTFDEIDLQLHCAINQPPEGYANRYRISVGNPELYEYTPQEVLDQIQAEQAANDDLVLKLGEINEVDQAKLNASTDEASSTRSEIDNLASAEANLDTDTSDIDFSAPEIVTEGVEYSKNFWDVFFRGGNLSIFLIQLISVSILFASIKLVLFGLSK